MAPPPLSSLPCPPSLPSPSLRSAPPPLDKNNGSAGLGSGGLREKGGRAPPPLMGWRLGGLNVYFCYKCKLFLTVQTVLY